MDKHGFLLKKLRLVGRAVEATEVTFEAGLNVIVGPSDTGKTYIFQCIDYMLGSSKKPKPIPEAKGYENCLLEIKSYNDKSYTLERSLKGGDLKLYKNKIDKPVTSEFLKGDNKGSNKSVSDFLLQLCNIENKKVRKNAKGVTRNLYFQDLKRYFLIDEERIIEENTPIQSEQLISKTFEQNVFKFLLTGQDDSSVITLLTKDEVTNKKGKLELFEEIIAAIKLDLPELTNKTDIDNQIDKVNRAIESFKKEYSFTKETFEKHDSEKNNLYRNLLHEESRINTLNELLTRTNILERHYNSDIARLSATIEASNTLENIEVFNCPICNSDLSKQNTVDLESINQASLKEIEKTVLLKNELQESVELFNEEQMALVKNHDNTRMSYDKVLEVIENEVNRNLSAIESRLNKLINKKSELIKSQTIFIELAKFEDQKEKMAAIIQENKEQGKDTNFEKLSVYLLQTFTELMHSILEIIKFDNLGKSVGFSEDELDFVIAEKNRKDYGKGYRAILYAIFSITLLEYLKTKTYRIGFTVIDTPLNPYKPDEAKDGQISKNLAWCV